MSLTDDIARLRNRALSDLNIVHDYYTDTLLAWRIVRKVVRAGYQFTIRKNVTGTVTSEADLVRKARGYIPKHLAEEILQLYLANFENWFFDLLRLWLLAYPQSLSGKQIAFKFILAAADKEAIVGTIVDKELNEVRYERPAEWFAYLDEKAKLGCPKPEQIERLAEAKATRDVLVHNRGVANKIYLAKSGPLARFGDGERIEVPEDYLQGVWELLRAVIAEISDAAHLKLSQT